MKSATVLVARQEDRRREWEEEREKEISKRSKKQQQEERRTSEWEEKVIGDGLQLFIQFKGYHDKNVTSDRHKWQYGSGDSKDCLFQGPNFLIIFAWWGFESEWRSCDRKRIGRRRTVHHYRHHYQEEDRDVLLLLLLLLLLRIITCCTDDLLPSSFAVISLFCFPFKFTRGIQEKSFLAEVPNDGESVSSASSSFSILVSCMREDVNRREREWVVWIHRRMLLVSRWTESLSLSLLTSAAQLEHPTSEPLIEKYAGMKKPVKRKRERCDGDANVAFEFLKGADSNARIQFHSRKRIPFSTCTHIYTKHTGEERQTLLSKNKRSKGNPFSPPGSTPGAASSLWVTHTLFAVRHTVYGTQSLFHLTTASFLWKKKAPLILCFLPQQETRLSLCPSVCGAHFSHFFLWKSGTRHTNVTQNTQKEKTYSQSALRIRRRDEASSFETVHMCMFSEPVLWISVLWSDVSPLVVHQISSRRPSNLQPLPLWQLLVLQLFVNIWDDKFDFYESTSDRKNTDWEENSGMGWVPFRFAICSRICCLPFLIVATSMNMSFIKFIRGNSYTVRQKSDRTIVVNIVLCSNSCSWSRQNSWRFSSKI